MTSKKHENLSFSGYSKENIPGRLRVLIGSRSIRSAAKDWGLSFSTLNNYLSRKIEPSLEVALKISSAENVSIEWICGLENYSYKNQHEQKEPKEPVIERIFKLVARYPSRSEAARAWGININTMQNYYKRRHHQPAPLPREQQLKKIAECEDVSMEWLLTGEGTPPEVTKEKKSSLVQKKAERPLLSQNNKGVQTILSAWEALSKQEQELLTKLLLRKGAEFLTILLDNNIQELHELEGVRRLLALQLKNIPNERVREIYEKLETSGDQSNLTDRQASA